MPVREAIPYRSDISLNSGGAVRPPIRISINAMKADQPALYRQYVRAEKEIKWGMALMISGGACGVVGGIGYVLMVADLLSYRYDEKKANTHFDMYRTGSITCLIIMGAGAPLLVVGAVKRGKALRAYRRTLVNRTTDAHFQINAHRNGLGLAYVF
jgi:hypothetical protein